MMAEYEVREGAANVFRNKDKKADNHPDFRAQVLVDGQLKDIALWERTDRNGNPYFGFKISEGRPRENKPQANKAGGFSRPLSQELDDDIPFSL